MDDLTNLGHTSCLVYDFEGHQTDRRDTAQTYNDDYSKRDTTVTAYTRVGGISQVLTTSYHAPSGDPTLGYDADGKLHHVEMTRSDLTGGAFETIDVAGPVGTGYDQNGRLLQFTTTMGASLTGSSAVSRTQNLSYDNDGNLTGRKHPGSGNTDFDTAMQYFPSDQVKTLANRGKTTTFSYQLDGRESGRGLGNNLAQSSSYFQNGALKELKLQSGTQAPLLDYSSLTYDGDGQKLSEAVTAVQQGGLTTKSGTAAYLWLRPTRPPDLVHVTMDAKYGDLVPAG